jgi:hypothetical protein
MRRRPWPLSLALLVTGALLYWLAVRQRMEVRDPARFLALVLGCGTMLAAATWHDIRRAPRPGPRED